MKHFNVLITEQALTQMEAIYRYISEELESPENALNQYNRISDAILSLETFPDRFHRISTTNLSFKDLHRMNIDNYATFYLVRNNQVIIVVVLYGHSDVDRFFS